MPYAGLRRRRRIAGSGMDRHTRGVSRSESRVPVLRLGVQVCNGGGTVFGGGAGDRHRNGQPLVHLQSRERRSDVRPH